MDNNLAMIGAILLHQSIGWGGRQWIATEAGAHGAEQRGFAGTHSTNQGQNDRPRTGPMKEGVIQQSLCSPIQIGETKDFI
jgi:hypothetical protein